MVANISLLFFLSWLFVGWPLWAVGLVDCTAWEMFIGPGVMFTSMFVYYIVKGVARGL